MREEKDYFVILKSILLGSGIAFVLFFFLLRIKLFTDFLNSSNNFLFSGVTALLFFIYLLTWASSNKFWQRYRKTYELKNRDFLEIDFIALTIFSLCLVFVTLSVISNIAVSRCFWLFLAINLTGFFAWIISSFYFIKTKKQNSEERSDYESEEIFLDDEPIESLADDSLLRGEFIEKFYNEISNIPFERSFVFGLIGNWGNGKTSALNILCEKLKNDEEFIVVKFNPWFFLGEKSTLEAFYSQIEQSICKRFLFNDLHKTLKKYRSLISYGLGKFGVDGKQLIQDESAFELRDKIQDYILKTNKKLLILIDDLDRLSAKEVEFIFKLVKLNTNIKNSIFILSYDDKQLLKNISKDYLEKIIQKPVKLPEVEQSILDKFFDIQLDKIIEKADLDETQKALINKEFPYAYQTRYRKYFSNLRRVKRFVNSFATSYLPVAKEVKFEDFFTLELIKIFFPRLYDDIWESPWAYISVEWSDNMFLRSPHLYSDDHQKSSLRKKHIEEKIAEYNYPSEEVTGLLKELFPEVQNAFSGGALSGARISRKNKEITHPECFVKYFILKVPSDEIPDQNIEQIVSGWNKMKDLDIKTVEKDLIAFKKNNTLLNFLKRTVVFIPTISLNTALVLIDALCKNSKRFSKEGTENFWNSEFDKADALVLWLIEEKVPKDKIQQVLEKSIKSSDLCFAANLLLSCHQERGGSLFKIYEAVNLPKLKKILSNRFKRHFVSSNKNIFNEYSANRDWVFLLAQWSHYMPENKPLVTDYIIRLLDLNQFIRLLDNYRSRDREFSLEGRKDVWSKNIDIESFSGTYLLNKMVKHAEELLKGAKEKNKKQILENFINQALGFLESQKTKPAK